MTEEIVERAKSLYSSIVGRDPGRGMAAISELERITGRQFRNTADFHREMEAFFTRGDRIWEKTGMRIHQARKKARLTQGGLAELLGVHKRTIIRWEKNEISPSPKALEWLNGQSALYGEKVT